MKRSRTPRDAGNSEIPVVTVGANDAPSHVLPRAIRLDAIDHVHLAPVCAVGLSDGTIAVRVEASDARPLCAVLAEVGSLTEGAALTLAVPIVGVLLALIDADLTPTVTDDDIVVDESGAVLVRANPIAAPDGRSGNGLRVLLFAVRAVWEAVDARSPVRADVELRVDEALRDCTRDALRALDAAIRAGGPARPVRVDLRPTAARPASVDDGAGVRRTSSQRMPERMLRWLAERAVAGIPLGKTRRISARHALIGVVVAAGAVFATTGLVDSASAHRSTHAASASTPKPTVASSTPIVQRRLSDTHAQIAADALRLVETRRTCGAREDVATCLRAPTATGSILREEDDLRSGQPYAENDPETAALMDERVTRAEVLHTARTDDGQLAFVRLLRADGTTSASALLTRTEADGRWLITSGTTS